MAIPRKRSSEINYQKPFQVIVLCTTQYFIFYSPIYFEEKLVGHSTQQSESSYRRSIQLPPSQSHTDSLRSGSLRARQLLQNPGVLDFNPSRRQRLHLDVQIYNSFIIQGVGLNYAGCVWGCESLEIILLSHKKLNSYPTCNLDFSLCGF